MVINGIYIGVYKYVKGGKSSGENNALINKFQPTTSIIVVSKAPYAYFEDDSVVYKDYARFNGDILILDKYVS